MTDVSKAVKLNGRLPGSIEANGLLSILTDLLKEPNTERLAVVWYDAPTKVVDNQTGDEIPKIAIRRFEPMGTTDTASHALREMVMQTAEARLGYTPLPFDETDPSGVKVLSDDEAAG